MILKWIWAETTGNKICSVNNRWWEFWQWKTGEQVGDEAITLRGGLFHIHTCVSWQNKCQNLQPYDSKIMHSMASYRFWMKSNWNTFVRTWHDQQNTLLFQTAVCSKYYYCNMWSECQSSLPPLLDFHLSKIVGGFYLYNIYNVLSA